VLLWGEKPMAKVAVITGSNGLIGQTTCCRLAQSGHLAVGSDVGADGAGNWPHYQCDLRDLARMEAMLALIERDHGLIRVLFNHAGIYHPGKVAKRLIAAGETGAIVSTALLPDSAAAPWPSMAHRRPPSSI
jgi:NAD(P)-dependent dehydrogenase (short-subunit alcohol dehydrogenase family)